MQFTLRPLHEQVIVITGASSGIGRATARLAAERGAAVVLAARQDAALSEIVDEIRRNGGRATFVTADVSSHDDVRGIAAHAMAEYGRIDTWINNAGTSIYGRIDETPLEDARRLFDTNYWGAVHGSLVAAQELNRHGGALINVGSMTSEVAMPLLGHYSASKHALKAFTDAFRIELAEAEAPISVSLVKPASIDTPFPEHARNLMEREPALPPPVYRPEVAARAILHCAEKPTRELLVGGSARMFTAWEHVAPASLDRYMETTMFEQQKSDEPASHVVGDTLYSPADIERYRERGRRDGYVMRTSAYTQSVMHPLLAVAATAAAVVIVGTSIRRAVGD